MVESRGIIVGLFVLTANLHYNYSYKLGALKIIHHINNMFSVLILDYIFALHETFIKWNILFFKGN